jgi:hypothetical protein
MDIHLSGLNPWGLAWRMGQGCLNFASLPLDPVTASEMP